MELRQVTLNSSTTCNFKCTYCAAEGPGYKLGTPDVPTSLKEKWDEGFRVVVFSGGEPTLQPQLPEWISLARQLGFQQRTIVTNASRLGSEGYVRELIEAGLSHVNISFHTCRPEIFDRISGGKGLYPKVIRGIRTIARVNRELGSPLFIHSNLVLMGPTIPDAGDTVRTLAEAGVTHVTLELCRFKGAARLSAAELAYTLDEAMAGVSVAMRAAKEVGVRLNLADVPGCFFGDLDDLDLEGYLIRRKKAVHWVMGGGTKGGPINRSTHVKAASCSECLVDAWCSGFEKSLVKIVEGAAVALDAGPLPVPLQPEALLGAARAALRQGVEGADSHVLNALSLTAPPRVEAIPDWLATLEHWGRRALADGNSLTCQHLGVFPPMIPKPLADPLGRVRQLVRAERLVEQKVGAIEDTLGQGEVSIPDCCRGALVGYEKATSDSALFHLHGAIRGERRPELQTAATFAQAPFVTCRAGCEAAVAVARSRISQLDSQARYAFDKLAQSPVLHLGPWVRVFLTSSGDEQAGLVSYTSQYVVLTHSRLPLPIRHNLMVVFAFQVAPLLEAGNALKLEDEEVLVLRDSSEVGRLNFRVKWVSPLTRATEYDICQQLRSENSEQQVPSTNSILR